jgi:hypothetical protein
VRRVALDTNLLLLYLVGNHSRHWMQWKRLARFDVACLRWLKAKTKGCTHVTLPNILTEASNLFGAEAEGKLPIGGVLLAQYVSDVAEVYAESAAVVRDPAFAKLGLADTALLQLGKQGVQILTVDFALEGLAKARNIMAHNLWHDQTPRGKMRL